MRVVKPAVAPVVGVTDVMLGAANEYEPELVEGCDPTVTETLRNTPSNGGIVQITVVLTFTTGQLMVSDADRMVTVASGPKLVPCTRKHADISALAQSYCTSMVDTWIVMLKFPPVTPSCGVIVPTVGGL